MQKIKEKNDLYEIALQSIGDAVVATDIHNNIIIMNSVAEKMTGWVREDALGKPLNEVFVFMEKKSNSIIENPFRLSLEQGLTIGLNKDDLLLSRDGSSRYASASSSPIRDTNNKIVGIIVVLRDISRIRNNEEQIRKLSLIIEQTRNAVIITDTNRIIEYANPSFIQLT
ncbi:MAG: PAS domain-containing protein, partial [Syntrophomonadaceae bacterium]|nr:PAS domain-containing protein [Syntrophomonadaceae bacterium]